MKECGSVLTSPLATNRLPLPAPLSWSFRAGPQGWSQERGPLLRTHSNTLARFLNNFTKMASASGSSPHMSQGHDQKGGATQWATSTQRNFMVPGSVSTNTNYLSLLSFFFILLLFSKLFIIFPFPFS